MIDDPSGTIDNSPRGQDCYVVDRTYTECICHEDGINGIVRGHDDSYGICALLNRNPRTIAQDPQEWQKLVGDQEKNDKLFSMAKYGPVFTIATPSSCKLDKKED